MAGGDTTQAQRDPFFLEDVPKDCSLWHKGNGKSIIENRLGCK